MILYRLACDSGHRFDSWFADSAAYDGQVARGLVTCPICLSSHVAKTIMAPALLKGAHGQPQTPEKSADTDKPAPVEVALLDDGSRELRALFRDLRDRVVAQGEDVGERFALEARRIHDGETPVRQIYGQASLSDARDLLDDGIMILPMPAFPDEMN